MSLKPFLGDGIPISATLLSHHFVLLWGFKVDRLDVCILELNSWGRALYFGAVSSHVDVMVPTFTFLRRTHVYRLV